ncbi:MAG: serine--tRNA ligase, partial [Pseudomonadota bacterium]
MHDIRAIRDDPSAFDAALARRGLSAEASTLLDLDAKRRGALSQLQDLQTERNEASKQIGVLKREGGDAQALQDRVGTIKGEMARLEEEARHFEEALNQHLAALPNLPANDVPEGADESANVEIHRWGDPSRLNNPKQHFDIGAALGGMDFEEAAKLSGARFVLLKGDIARLARALGEMMLDLHTTE